MEDQQACQAPPCIHIVSTGKHEWNCISWRHQAGDPRGLFIAHCETCGWVDMSRTIRSMPFVLKLRLLMNWI